MKRVFVFPTLLLLVACSSTGGAYNIGQRVDTVGASNARVTNMRTHVDNRLEVIEYAQSVGVVPVPKTDGATSGADASRVAHSGPAYNRKPNVREQEDEKIGEYYKMAQVAFQNMYNIYKNGMSADMGRDAIKNAYLIAGGLGWSDDLTDDEITGVIVAQIENAQYQADVLDKYFNSGATLNSWLFEPKTETINDVDFDVVSSDDVLSFTMDDTGKIMHIGWGDKNYVRDGDKSNVFLHKDSTTGDEIRVSIAKPDINLKYSDFGRIVKTISQIDSEGKVTSQDTYQNVFAGGYKLKHIDRDAVVAVAGDGINFKGTATGVIRGQQDSIMPVSGDATLNVKGGTETVDLMFANDSQARNWYNVHIVNTGDRQTILFKDDPAVRADFQLSQTGVEMTFDGMNVDYYGDRGNPTEYVGTATYADTNGVLMDAAFGGVLEKTKN